jgi:hypothetical protein
MIFLWLMVGSLIGQTSGCWKTTEKRTIDLALAANTLAVPNPPFGDFWCPSKLPNQQMRSSVGVSGCFTRDMTGKTGFFVHFGWCPVRKFKPCLGFCTLRYTVPTHPTHPKPRSDGTNEELCIPTAPVHYMEDLPTSFYYLLRYGAPQSLQEASKFRCLELMIWAPLRSSTWRSPMIKDMSYMAP